MMKLFFRIAVIAFAGIMTLGSGQVQADNLPRAVKQVLKTHPQIKELGYNRQARTQEVVQAKGAYYPTLGGAFSLGYMKQDKPEISNDKSWPKQHTLGARQNLFRGGADVADVDRQKAREKSQAFLLQGTSENIALLTTRVYINVLLSSELHELAKQNLVNHERIADQVKLRMQSGVDSRAELEQVMGRLALAQSNVVVTAANLNDAITDYQAVVGRHPGQLAEIERLEAALPATLDEAEHFALNNYPIVKSAKADLEARQFQYEVARRLLSPTLDVAADYNWNDDVYPEFDRRDYFTATAAVTYNIFNGGRDYGRIQETKYLIKEAEEILKNTERETVQSIRLSWEANEATKERVAHLEDYVKAAEATADAFATQWSIGRRTMFDLLDTQAEAINSKSDLTKANYDQTYAQFRILSGMGKLVHSMGLEWPEASIVEEASADAGAEAATAKE